MSFSANYRRIRAPQQPLFKIATRIGLTFIIICIFYTLFGYITVGRHEGQAWNSIFGNADESNPSYEFTNYRNAVNQTMTKFWLSIHPGFTCPAHFLSRVGTDHGKDNDKGKWICGLKSLGSLKGSLSSPPCVIYSFSMEGDSYFEAELLEKTNCSVYTFDPMRWMAGPPLELTTSSRHHFQRLTIGHEDKEVKRTLELLMELNGHRWIDILKIEINSGEFRALERVLSDFRTTTWPIGQLIVKFHVADWQKASNRWLIALFELLEYRGLRLFYNQVNPYSPCCAEFSFINVNALSKFISDDKPQENDKLVK